MYAMCIINYNCVFARLFDDGLLYLIIDFVRLAYNVLYYYPGIYIRLLPEDVLNHLLNRG